ncbi:NAD(P)/FAD-dependent oxidoreductase [Brevundimonas sp. R86498]|uniref:NAD(P)/FAD-dependent oxidoreductase n=1 Tax=Brevundimonas sp. R86498 TaxID=3093845 RepID=UPI0037C518AD
MNTVVIGGGMAGLSCARALGLAGHAVTVIDKGRGPGGRMATRRLTAAGGEITFDLGTPAFEARSPAFLAEVRQWASDGHAAPWPAAGADSWVGVPAMNAPLKAMADGLDVRWSTRVSEVSPGPDGWQVRTEAGDRFEADTVVVALPADQAADLLEPVQAGMAGEMAARARACRSRPCWTVLLAFAERLPILDDWREGNAADALGLAVRNAAKPGRSGPETWVLHAGADWSARHLEEPADRIADLLITALSERLAVPLPAILARGGHRWRYATPVGGGTGPVWDPALRLGLCGDWLGEPGVEGAWLSARDLAARILAAGRGPD